MLIEFTVENFLSFKERTTFSMLADSAISEGLENTFNVSALAKSEKLLNIAVIYGQNAAGKSNLLKALYFLCDAATSVLKKTDLIPVRPFKLDAAYEQKASSFELHFLIEGTRYTYGFVLDSKKIHEEYLYYWSGKNQKLVFERKNTEEFEFAILPKNSEERIRQDIFKEQTPDNTLFLAQSAHFKMSNHRLTEVYNWFYRKMKFIIPQAVSHEFVTYRRALNDKKFKERLIQYLNDADFSIDSFDIEVEDIDFSSFPVEIRERLINQLTSGNIGLEEIKLPLAKIYRKGKNKRNKETAVEFDMDEESEGTKKFVQLVGPIDYVLQYGYPLIVDELDLHLHPLLIRKLIQLFQSKVANPKNAQLIFTTHNVGLLDLDLFRKDQFWFVNKNHECQSSELYSLNEFMLNENDKDIQLSYLLGRFGAIPNV